MASVYLLSRALDGALSYHQNYYFLDVEAMGAEIGINGSINKEESVHSDSVFCRFFWSTFLILGYSLRYWYITNKPTILNKDYYSCQAVAEATVFCLIKPKILIFFYFHYKIKIKIIFKIQSTKTINILRCKDF